MKTKLIALFLLAGSCAFAAPFRVGVRVGVGGYGYGPYVGGYRYYAPPVVPYVAPYAVAPYSAYGYGYPYGYGYGVGIGIGGYGYGGYGYRGGYGVRVAPRVYGGGRVGGGRRR